MTLSKPLCLVLSMIAALAACEASEPSDTGSGGMTSTSSTSGTAGSSSSSTGFGGFGGAISTGGGGGGVPTVAEVFGHSATVLYKLNPITHVVTEVGPFAGCSSVIDLAIDKNNHIYATTFGGLYTINKQTAACTEVTTGTFPNSLSFVPEGTLSPTTETLVGYRFSDYVRIDTTTGVVTTIAPGTLGGYESSGDIVSVIGGGTYLTIKGGTDCADTDCLVEVDPVTGAVLKSFGSIPYNSVFGLAFWGGSAYGFTAGGDLFHIAFNGDTVTTTLIPIPGAPSNLSFWGAGSSTAAPLEPPR